MKITIPAMHVSALVVAVAWFFSLSAQAALTAVDLDGDLSNGHEGVYDDVLDITWLANARLKSNLNWAGAEAEIAALNAAGYLG
ncbi:MAG: hypothetical protein WBN40_12015, partial [Pseudomonadales bacterium]